MEHAAREERGEDGHDATPPPLHGGEHLEGQRAPHEAVPPPAPEVGEIGHEPRLVEDALAAPAEDATRAVRRAEGTVHQGDERHGARPRREGLGAPERAPGEQAVAGHEREDDLDEAHEERAGPGGAIGRGDRRRRPRRDRSRATAARTRPRDRGSGSPRGGVRAPGASRGTRTRGGSRFPSSTGGPAGWRRGRTPRAPRRSRRARAGAPCGAKHGRWPRASRAPRPRAARRAPRTRSTRPALPTARHPRGRRRPHPPRRSLPAPRRRARRRPRCSRGRRRFPATRGERPGACSPRSNSRS